MTVEQLIEKLKEFPPYREVAIGWNFGSTSSIVSVREEQGTGHPVVVVR